MKKKGIKIVASTLAAILMMTGCGPTAAPDAPEDNAAQETDSADTASADNEAEAETESTNSQGLKLPEATEEQEASSETPDSDEVYTYTDTVHPYEDYDGASEEEISYSYDMIYNLYTKNDGTATLIVDTVYNPNKSFTETYVGKWSEGEDAIEFAYESDDTFDGNMNYTFSLKRGKIESVDTYSVDEMVAAAAGTYTCSDPEMGELTLEIKKNGRAILTMDDGTVYNGYINSEGARYDFYCFDENDEIIYDWYVDCSVNGTFSHSPYGDNSDSIHYNGLYKCTGNLGDFDMSVNVDGTAYATIKIDDKDRYFTGNAYGKYTENGYDYNNIGEVYLSDEEGYSLYIELDYMWDVQKWNYHGNLSVPLPAG